MRKLCGIRKMAEEKSDAVPVDAPVVEPSDPSGGAAAVPEPAPEVKVVKPKRTYNRKPKEPKPEPKPEPVPEPVGPALDPQFFAGLNATLRDMMKQERKSKISGLRIV